MFKIIFINFIEFFINKLLEYDQILIKKTTNLISSNLFSLIKTKQFLDILLLRFSVVENLFGKISF